MDFQPSRSPQYSITASPQNLAAHSGCTSFPLAPCQTMSGKFSYISNCSSPAGLGHRKQGSSQTPLPSFVTRTSDETKFEYFSSFNTACIASLQDQTSGGMSSVFFTV